MVLESNCNKLSNKRLTNTLSVINLVSSSFQTAYEENRLKQKKFKNQQQIKLTNGQFLFEDRDHKHNW